MRLDAAGNLRPHPDRPLRDKGEPRVRAVCAGIGLANDAVRDKGMRRHPFWRLTIRVSEEHR